MGAAAAATDRDGRIADAEFLREVLAASEDCIKVLDLDGRLTFMSEGGKRVMEVSDFNSLRGCPWPDFWEGQGNVEAKAALATARAGGSARFQGFARTAIGTPKWWDVQVTPIRGPDGAPARILSVSRDITELRQAEEDRRVLMHELQHRVKNTLAMVQAIANQTFRGETAAPAKADFAARLVALGRAHDVLTDANWTAASISEVVEGALIAHRTSERRFRIDGPDLKLAAKPALALALALHELATNATKYGALSTQTGHVAISWAVHDGTFRLLWREAGGPPVSPPSRQGFGTRLIERSIAAEFQGQANIDYAPGGVTCEIVGPANAL